MPTDYATLRADQVRWEAHQKRCREWYQDNKRRKSSYNSDYNHGLITRHVYKSIGKDGRLLDFTGPFKLRHLAIEWGKGEYGRRYWRKRGVRLKLCKVEHGTKNNITKVAK